MKRLLVGAALLSPLLYGAVVTRPMLGAMERMFKANLDSLFKPDELFGIIDSPQSVYVDGFGVVMTARVNLVEAPGLMLFRPALKPEEIRSIRERKLQRVPMLENAVRQSMVIAATLMETVPVDEQIVYSVNLFHHPYEESRGLPSQIVLQASRKTLLALAKQPDKAALAAALKLKEF